jgi:hypothetical protein
MIDNQKAYELLVDSTKATFNATGRSWESLSDVEKGERIQAQRAGFSVVLGYYEEQGFGQRTRYMRAMVEATDGPAPLDAEEGLQEARNFFAALAAGSSRQLDAAAAQRIVDALDNVELAD